MGQLRSQNVLTQGYRFAQTTRKGLISHIRTWFFFSLYFGLFILPATEDSLCMFLELMSLTCGYAHCKALLSTVKYLHAAIGYSFPHTFSLDCTLQGLKRRLSRTPFQVLPIDPSVLRLMYKGININKRSDLALWCSFLTAFYCLFRKANTVPKDDKFDPNCILTRENISIDKSSRTVYVYGVFTVRLKELLSKAGLEPSLYSGHSFRRGGASFLFSIGGSQLMVQVLGDWSSMVYTRYLYMSADDRMAAQVLIAENINSTIL